MSDWVTVPSLVDGRIMRAKTFQDIATDLYLLKNPALVETPGPAIAGGAWTFSTVGAWVEIDPTYYQVSFTTQGNAILVVTFVRFSHSAAGGNGFFRLMLDGVAFGNTVGQFGGRDAVNVPETYCYADIIENVAEGDHALKLQVENTTVGNTEVWKDYANLSIWVFEF